MKKLSIVVGILTAFLIVTAFNAAHAGNNSNKRCQNVHGIFVDCSETNNTDNSINNDNSNSNSNYNKNFNTNLNYNSNRATSNSVAAAAAFAKQGQTQGQVGIVQNDISIKDQRKTVQTIIDFNHITPDIGKTNADLPSMENARDVKTKGFHPAINSITLAYATKMSKGSGDVEIIESIMFENDFRTNMLSRGVAGAVMGTITLTSDGEDVTADGMFARAMVRAMSLGATHFTLLGESNDLVNQGSKAGLDFGGAASVVTKADGSVVMAPGATLGYSTAWTINEYRPSMVFTLYYHEASVSLPAGQTGNHK
jgi:hypothetical protein